MTVTAIAGEVVLQIGPVQWEFCSQSGSDPYTKQVGVRMVWETWQLRPQPWLEFRDEA